MTAYAGPAEYADVITECQACGASVSRQFVRVFGGNDGAAYACRECSTWEDIKKGASVSASADGTRDVSVGPAVGAERTESASEDEANVVGGLQVSPSNGVISGRSGSQSDGPAFADLLG